MAVISLPPVAEDQRQLVVVINVSRDLLRDADLGTLAELVGRDAGASMSDALKRAWEEENNG